MRILCDETPSEVEEVLFDMLEAVLINQSDIMKALSKMGRGTKSLDEDTCVDLEHGANATINEVLKENTATMKRLRDHGVNFDPSEDEA